MKELCLVPTFRRPEMLHCCLEAIRRAEPSLALHVFPDRSTDEMEICAKFDAVHHWTWNHNFHGNSANMLEALKWASTQSCGLVFVVEDDSIVSPDFFQWCRDALARRSEAFAACGWRYSPDAPSQDGPDLLLPWYLSVCAAIPRHSLSAIVQHARPEYYSAMASYLDRAYPSSPHRGTLHYEQDGLVLRTMLAQSRRAVWPRRPRALHIGWHGYHSSGSPPPGSFDERLSLVRLAIANPAILSSLMSGAPLPHLIRCHLCGRSLVAVRAAESRRPAVCAVCFHERYPSLPVASASHYFVASPAAAATR